MLPVLRILWYQPLLPPPAQPQPLPLPLDHPQTLMLCTNLSKLPLLCPFFRPGHPGPATDTWVWATGSVRVLEGLGPSKQASPPHPVWPSPPALALPVLGTL